MPPCRSSACWRRRRGPAVRCCPSGVGVAPLRACASAPAWLGLVLFSALITDEGDDYGKPGEAAIREELGQAARYRPRGEAGSSGSWCITLALIAVALCTVLYVHTADWKLGDKIFAPVLIAAFLALFVPLCLRDGARTPAGVTAGWTSCGLMAMARPVLHAPGPSSGQRADRLGVARWTGSSPLPKDRAWSSLGGQCLLSNLGQTLTPAFWSTKSGLYFVLALTFIGSFTSLDDYWPRLRARLPEAS